jgi:hypothetical protein
MRRRHLYPGFLAIAPALAWSLNCPELPKQTNKDWNAEIEAAVGRLGPAKAAEVGIRANAVTRDLMGKLPNADIVYLEQMMYATYCSALKGASLTEEEKSNRLLKANAGVRDAILDVNRARPRGTAPAPRPVKPPALAPTPASSSRSSAAVPAASPINASRDLGHQDSVRNPGASTSTSMTAVLQNGQWIVRDGALAPASATQLANAPALAESPGASAPMEPWLDSAVSLRGVYHESFSYASKKPWRTHQWQGEVTWRELFKVMSPYLVGSPRQDQLAAKVARRIIAPGQPLEGDFQSAEFGEADWQLLFFQFRSRGLIGIRTVDYTDGTKGVFVSETDKGIKLMTQIFGVGSSR